MSDIDKDILKEFTESSCCLYSQEEIIEATKNVLSELEYKERRIASKIIIINSKNEYIKHLEEYVKELGGEI